MTSARELGAPPGGDIMIHGIRTRFGWLNRINRVADWTHGCIAVTNPEIREIRVPCRAGRHTDRDAAVSTASRR